MRRKSYHEKEGFSSGDPLFYTTDINYFLLFIFSKDIHQRYFITVDKYVSFGGVPNEIVYCLTIQDRFEYNYRCRQEKF